MGIYWKLIYELLIGVNRVFSFAYGFNCKTWIKRNLNHLIFIVHTDFYNTGSQALLMLYKFSVLYNEFSHRLYAVIYDVLQNKPMIRATNSIILFSTLFKMLKKDSSPKRMEVFVKRMLEVAIVTHFFSTGVILVIISKLIRIHKAIWKNIFNLASLEKQHLQNNYVKKSEPNQNSKVFVALFISSKLMSEKKVENILKSKLLTKPLHEMRKRKYYNVNYHQTQRISTYRKDESSYLWKLLLIANHVPPKIAAISR